MNASGQRDKRVLLENPGDPVPDGEGGYVEGWEPLNPAEVFAHIEPATARDAERSLSGTVVSSASHVITIPYHPGVTVETRITWRGRVFNVTAVRNPDEADRELVIAAEESTDARTGTNSGARRRTGSPAAPAPRSNSGGASRRR